ncbi:sensor histidine kinase [Falsiroseomonas stagni]|uniref:histidine kinase n=1 Tax=Falsiroseomonas stagni DSM 19981 TaxID=1123062 RepID=A0A1I4DJ03_9PROT|nr:ATP-binding protein [Falsiroseomonas stagni]SFK93638.1 His Kinase A (phospho-acceptor) domain-containing protein [Falsiroseomonas stagni DSM 19981]
MTGLDTGRIDPRIVRVITALALTVSILIMVALPAAYFIAARVSITATLQARAGSAANVMTEFVTRNPDHWVYENARITGRLVPFTEAVAPKHWRILDRTGAQVATLGTPATKPAITVSQPIYDSGVVAGAVEVSRSISDVLAWTVFLAVIGTALAGGSFLLLRTLPLRLLAESMERLERLQALERERVAQLAQASKLAQLGELATGMAHELNQPLTAITLAAQNAMKQLERGALDAPSLAARLDRILQMARRASTVIDHMRIFGRMDGEASAPITLAAAVRGARDLLAFKLERHRVRVVDTLPPDLPPVVGQAVPLEQVLVNLIANACDAYGEPPADADAPPRLIAIAAAATEGWVCLTVRDEAGGIPPDILPRIFAPFFTTKPVGQGTGLGLSISYGIINDMGGTLAAESANGSTTFVITLPAGPRDNRPAGPVSDLPAPPAGPAG